MSKPSSARPNATWVSLSIEELARLQGANPVEDAMELAADVWESDDELDEFMADLRSSRAVGMA